MHPDSQLQLRQRRTARLLRLLGPALTGASLLLVTAAPARAEYPLVGVLTGGELRSTGSGTIATDEVATDFVNDPASVENCTGDMCGDHRDLTFHQKADLRFDTSWLVDARYPGVPTDPAASANAVRWNERVGSWSVHRLEEDFQFPNDQGDGGHDENPVVDKVDCETALVARQPAGTEAPLWSTAAGEAFDASKGRSFHVNAYGATFNANTCGDNDRYGFFGIVGFVPVEGDSIAWDLGPKPREDFRWERKGRIDKTEGCDPRWTDGTPRDVEKQCAQTTKVTADNVLSCALCVTDVRYDQHPGGGTGWEEVGRDGTWDGNEVRITAVIENRTERSLTVPLLIRDEESGRALEGPGFENPKTYAFNAGATTTIEVVWKTDGYAWEKGKPRSERNIQFLTPYGGAQQRILVKPRPMVTVHGWNSDAEAWEKYPAMVKAIHPQWQSFAVGDGRYGGTMDTDPRTGADIRDNAAAEGRYIQRLREDLSADHVDVVAHSMGGLISRQYIHGVMGNAVDGRPVVRRLVMLGTPNQGSPCADMIRVVARGVPTQQLTTGFARWFNTAITNRKGVAFSIAAGDFNERTCSSEVLGDGVVEVPSAHWVLGDRITTFIFHTWMTGDQHLLDSFVKPRLGLDPDGAKALGAATSASRSASTRGRADGAAGDADATPTRRVAASTDPAATRSLAASGTSSPKTQAVDTADVKVAGTRSIRVRFEKGSKPAFGFLAPPTMGAELVDPAGKVVATQAAGSPAAQAPVRWLQATAAGRAGRWSLRLTGTGPVHAAAVALGGRTTLAATAARTKKGALVISASAKTAGRSITRATVRAALAFPGQKARTVTLRAIAGGRYSATVRNAPSGSGSATVTLRQGPTRLVTAATVD